MSILFSSFCRPQSFCQDLDLWCGTLSNTVWKCKSTLFTARGQRQYLLLKAGGFWMYKHWHFLLGLCQTQAVPDMKFWLEIARSIVWKGIIGLLSSNFTVYNKTSQTICQWLRKKTEQSVLSIAPEWTMGVKKCFSFLFFPAKTICGKGFRNRSIWLLYPKRSLVNCEWIFSLFRETLIRF